MNGREIPKEMFNILSHQGHAKLDSREPNNPIKNWGLELNREFSTEEAQMAKNYLKKCSTFLVSREI